MSNEPLTAPDGTPLDTRGRQITPARLRHALIVNIYCGVMGSAWYGVFGGGSQIFQVFFQNHLGANDRQLGWLTALGAFLAPLQLVSILIYSHLKTRKNFWVLGTAIHRLLGFVLGFVAVWMQLLSKDTPDYEHYRQVGIYLILVSSASSWILAQLSGVAWQSWMADLVPENIRASFFGRRGAIISLLNMMYFFLIQVSLDWVPAHVAGVPILYVYAVIFAITGAFGTIDIIIHAFIPEPRRHPGETQIGWHEFFEPVTNWNFLRFSLAIGLFGFTTGIFAQFQAPYITKPLEAGGIGAANVWIGVMTVIGQGVGILTLPAWGHVMDRFGRKPSVLLGALFPFAWVGFLFLTPTNYWIIIPAVSLASGLLAQGFMMGVFQLMLTLAPQKNRTGYAAWHNTVAGLIGAGGSILGGYLKEYVKDLHVHTEVLGRSIDFPGVIQGFPVTSFHVVGLLCFVLMVPTLFMLSRIREGKERPVGFLVSILTTPSTYRTFLSLGIIGRAASPRRTARALRRIDGVSGNLALAEILARLEDPDPDVREEAARALGRIRAPETVEPLIQHLRDPACTIRPEAASALGLIGDARAVPALVEGLSCPEPEIQQACARALEMIRKPTPRPRQVRLALRALRGPEGEMTVPQIIERLNDPDADVREEAARALGRLRSLEAVEVLIVHMRDPASKIRSEAALALGEIGDARAIPALVECLASESSEVQDACARALGDIGSREAVRHLMDLLHEKHTERVMAAGAEAVSRHGMVEAAWEIVPRMHLTANPVLRRQLAIATGNLLGKPGEFYVHLRGETSQQGRRLGRLFRGVRKAIRSFRPAAIDKQERAFLKMAEGDLKRIRFLLEAQSYREAVEALYEHTRGLVRMAIDRECDDATALEYALARDVRLGIGFWFMQEARLHMATGQDPDMLHTDALLVLYFLSQYRLPAACQLPKQP
jgi:HEAT repeat protein/MFS family permease